MFAMRARIPVVFGIFVGVLGASRPASAGDHPALRHDWSLDLSVTSLATGALLVTEISMKPALGPKACAWCEPPGIDTAVRDALGWGSGAKTADVLSTLLVVAIPAAGITANGLAANAEGSPGRDIGVDAMVVVETVSVALATDQLVKFTVARQRPDVHFRSPEDRARLATPDDNLSFYSGHTTFAFSAATAAGMVASMRGYRIAPYVWGAGMALAATTGYLRIAADRHYFTDVMLGAALGVGYGIAIPALFHGPRHDGSGAKTPLEGATFGVVQGAGSAPALGFSGVW